MSKSVSYRSGFASLTGRPNVGKSTLLNRFVGTKISITSQRPQTTRHRISGVVTTPDHQIVFVDTPGFHRGTGRAINKMINKAAESAVSDVDVILMVIDAKGWHPDDDRVLKLVSRSQSPLLLVINKIDQVKNREMLLPFLQSCQEKHEFAEIVPVSAKRGTQTERLCEIIARYLPEAPAGFDEDTLTDRPLTFIAAEFVREQLFRSLGQEVPYATTVNVERIEQHEGIKYINATIVVEAEGQKGIIIGKNGEKLKKLASRARLSLEGLLAEKVFLEVWVKVQEGWTDDPATLSKFGLSND